ncbi:MAG: hypothetical protein K9G62_08270 [Alphaproteobacteria bacterium]|nr:hypothetical protein [Alphaproteobacteria bacterium]
MKYEIDVISRQAEGGESGQLENLFHAASAGDEVVFDRLLPNSDFEDGSFVVRREGRKLTSGVIYTNDWGKKLPVINPPVSKDVLSLMKTHFFQETQKKPSQNSLRTSLAAADFQPGDKIVLNVPQPLESSLPGVLKDAYQWKQVENGCEGRNFGKKEPVEVWNIFHAEVDKAQKTPLPPVLRFAEPEDIF